MLSLPIFTPRADGTLWPSLRNTHTTFDPESNTSLSHPSRRHASNHHSPYPTRSLFSQLSLDENKQHQRNNNIRHFGSTWIRPPGIQKTYQALIDEEKEAREQDEIAQREQQLADLAAAQQEAANAEARAQAGEGEGEERDLDEDVPEAEGSVSDLSDENSSDGSEEENTRDVTFNEDSFIEGSMVEGRVGQMLAMEEASMEGSLLEERDLDEDVPEAGEYEHTDSSLIESSEEEEASFVQPGSRRSTRSTRSSRRSSAVTSGVRSVRRTSGMVSAHVHALPPPRMQAREQTQNRRISVELEGSSSMLEGSSFLRSSPAAARGSVRARLFGARPQR